jgi:hypothetical protein
MREGAKGPLCRGNGPVTLGGVMTQTQPPSRLATRMSQQTARRDLTTYEITFRGQAGATLRAEFDDCEVTIGPGTTTLRAELPDQAALSGLVQRITGLRLQVIRLHLVAPPSGTRT